MEYIVLTQLMRLVSWDFSQHASDSLPLWAKASEQKLEKFLGGHSEKQNSSYVLFKELPCIHHAIHIHQCDTFFTFHPAFRAIISVLFSLGISTIFVNVTSPSKVSIFLIFSSVCLRLLLKEISICRPLSSRTRTCHQCHRSCQWWYKRKFEHKIIPTSEIC